MKVLGNRVLLQVDIIKRKNQDGTEVDDISREGLVIAVGDITTDLKKGDKVYYNPFGMVEIESKRTKKSLFLCVDADDVYIRL